MTAVFITLDALLGFYTYIIIGSAIFSWLYAFNVVNSGNQFVGMIGNFLYQMTEPVYRPIRRYMPSMGSLDISPIIVLLLILFLRVFLQTTVAPMFGVFY